MIKQAVVDLISWTHSPEPGRLSRLLQNMTTDDLIFTMTTLVADPAGRLAWAEYGRRSGFVDFEFKEVVRGPGDLLVTMSGPAPTVHHGAIFEVKS